MKMFFQSVVIFLLSATLGLSQTKLWEQKISTTSTNSNFDPHLSAEFRDFKVGSDRNIYSVGFYRGNRALFGSLTAYPDSVRVKPYSGSTTPQCETSFISCQSPDGEFLWVKSLTFDNGNFAYLFPPYFIGNNYANKLTVGPDGSLYVLGIGCGDTVSFQNSAVHAVAPGTGKWGFYILKLSPSGGFQWIRNFPSGPPQSLGALTLDPSFISVTGDQVHAVFAHHQVGLAIGNSNVQENGHTLVRLGFDGSIAGTQTYSFPPQLLAQTGVPVLVRQIPDGKWIIGHVPGMAAIDSGSFITVLNADFSFLSRIRISALPLDLSGPSFTWPIDFFQLPGNLTGAIIGLSNARSLVYNGDTLDVLPGAKSVFIKLSDFTCMKKLETMNHYPLGVNSITGAGNILTYGLPVLPQFSSFSAGGVVMRQYDRNGELLDSFSTGTSFGAVSSNNYSVDYGNIGMPNSFYSTRVSGSELWVMQGASLSKFQISEVVVGDEAFSGCLSNRTLLTGISNVEIRKNWIQLTPKSGDFQIDLQGEGTGYLTMSTTGGQVVKRSILNPGENHLLTRGLPNGLYFLHVSDGRNIKCLKIQVLN